MFRNIPLNLKMLLVIVTVGATLWSILDFIQSRSIKKALHAELTERLSEQAQENRMLVGGYMEAYRKAVKIITSQKRLYDYVGKVRTEWDSKDDFQIKYHTTVPEWLPRSSIMRLLVNLRYAMLLDGRGKVREVYKGWPKSPPQSLLQPSNLLLLRSQDEYHLMTIDDVPYLVASESLHDSDGKPLTVLIASPLDSEFFLSSLGLSHSKNMVALVSGDTPSILSSSLPDILSPGTEVESLLDKYLITGKSFFDGDSELQMQFASFISKEEYELLGREILSKERQNRFIMTILLILSFSIVMIMIIRRVKSLTNRVIDFSEKTLEIHQDYVKRGDEICVLEERFHWLSGEIEQSHESMKTYADSLRKERDRAQNYLDIAEVIILALNDRGEVTLINKKGCSVLGYKEEDVLGKKWFDNFLPERTRKQARADLYKLMAGDNIPVEYLENEILTKGGEERIIAWHNTFLKNNEDEIIGTLSSGEDITKRKKAEKDLMKAYTELKTTQSQMLQREKMASIGQIAAGVAHEINNPIGFINSNLGSLGKFVNKLTKFMSVQTEALDSLKAADIMEELKVKRRKMKIDYVLKDIKDLINESLDGAGRIRKIVQNLKSFARVDEMDYKRADINECIESTLNIVWNELKYKTDVKKDYGEIPLTNCYPQQLNQVFMNLLVNAADAIEKEGEIKIKTWNGGEFINISISDTGRGIPEDKMDKVFEPFFTTKEAGKGTGLGLSISHDIVKKHNGEIAIESTEGKGTIFNIKIPVVRESVHA